MRAECPTFDHLQGHEFLTHKILRPEQSTSLVFPSFQLIEIIFKSLCMFVRSEKEWKIKKIGQLCFSETLILAGIFHQVVNESYGLWRGRSYLCSDFTV